MTIHKLTSFSFTTVPPGRQDVSPLKIPLARWLDGVSNVGVIQELPVQKILKKNPQMSLREVILSLPPLQRELLIQKVGEANLHTVFSISNETHYKIISNRLFSLGQQLERDGKLELAASIFKILTPSGSTPVGAAPGGRPSLRTQTGERATTWGLPLQVEPPLSKQAQRELDILRGTAPFLAQSELIFQQTSRNFLHPAGWLGFGAGMLASQLGKAASLGWILRRGRNIVSTQLGAKVVSNLFAFGLEGSAFTIATKIGHQIAGTNYDGRLFPGGGEFASGFVFLGGMKLVGGIAGWMLPTVGVHGRAPLRRFAETVTRQTSVLGGIALGHSLEVAAGLKDPQPFNQFAAQTISQWGQFGVMGKVSPWLLGNKFHSYLEKLEAQTQTLLKTGPGWKHLQPALALSVGAIHEWHQPPRINPIKLHTLFRTPDTQGPTSPIPWEPIPSEISIQRLKRKFQNQFPQEDYWSRKIFECATEDTPNPLPNLPDFHERHLQALAERPNRGTPEQYYTAKAISELFTFDALRTSIGSFNNLQLQFLYETAISRSLDSTRSKSLEIILNQMERGLSRPKLDKLVARILGPTYDYKLPFPKTSFKNFLKALPSFFGKLRNYSWSNRRQILRFAQHQSQGDLAQANDIINIFAEAKRDPQYQGDQLDIALDFARSHQLGRPMFHRIYHLLKARDVPGKLAEIYNRKDETDTIQIVEGFYNRGMASEGIAALLNDSYHTGYFKDRRVAIKMVKVMLEIADYIKDPNLMGSNKWILDEVYDEHMKSGRPWDLDALFNLWKVHGASKKIRQLEQAIREGELEIKFKTSSEMEKTKSEKAQSLQHLDAYFKGKEIVMRELPRRPQTPLEEEEFYPLVLHRIMALEHESDHWGYHTGNLTGIEKGGRLLIHNDMNKHDVYVSEILADLQESSWAIRHFTRESYEIAQRLGENLVLRARNFYGYNLFGGNK